MDKISKDFLIKEYKTAIIYLSRLGLNKAGTVLYQEIKKLKEGVNLEYHHKPEITVEEKIKIINHQITIEAILLSENIYRDTHWSFIENYINQIIVFHKELKKLEKMNGG